MAFCVGACLVCERGFSFNPIAVPSFEVDGVKEPICGACIEVLNEKRVALGMEPFSIRPDAYEPCDEEELL